MLWLIITFQIIRKKYLEKPTAEQQPKCGTKNRPGCRLNRVAARRRLADLHFTAMPSHLPRRRWRFKATSPACLFVSILPQTRKEAVSAAFKACVGCEVTEALKKDECGPRWMSTCAPAPPHRTATHARTVYLRPSGFVSADPPFPWPLGGGGKRRVTWP